MRHRLYILTHLFCYAATAFAADTELAALSALRADLPTAVKTAPQAIAAGGDVITVSLNDGATSEVIPLTASGDPSSSARRVHIAQASQPGWRVVAHSPVSSRPIAKGSNLSIAVWLRAPEVKGGASGTASLWVSLNRAPWTAVANSSATLDRSWKEVRLAGTAPQDFAAGELNVSVHLGLQEQVIDLGAIIVLDAGSAVALVDLPATRLAWGGMEANAPWRAEAAQRIARIRQVPATVTVIDTDGRPVAGANVTVTQQRTSFPFGSYTDMNTVISDSPEGERFRAAFLERFNHAAVPLFWCDWGLPKAQVNYEKIMAWTKAQNLSTRCELLVYPGWEFLPSLLKELRHNPAAFQQAILDHIAEMGRRYGDYPFRDVTVTNELRDLADEGAAVVGRAGVAAWFSAARTAFPGKRLVLNENTILTNGGATQANQDSYLEWYRYLKQQGVAPDVLGFQGHFTEAFTDPNMIWRILDRFASETDAALEITEFDINSLNETAQGAYQTDALTACFAHPRITGITMWGFFAGDMWQRNAALLRSDFSPKPNGLALNALIASWRSNATIVTGAEGTATIPVFLGTLAVEARVGARLATGTINADQAGKPVTSVLTIH